MAQLHLLSPQGFRGAGVYAGIKTKHTPDIGLLVCETRAAAAAVFTTNKVFAAPVKVGREHIADGRLARVVVNAGNANACTGKQGDKDAYRMCDLAAKAVGCDERGCSSLFDGNHWQADADGESRARNFGRVAISGKQSRTRPAFRRCDFDDRSETEIRRS